MIRQECILRGLARSCVVVLATAAAPFAHAVEYTEGPSITVKRFKGSGPQGDIMSRGLPDMLVTDLVRDAPPACKLAVVEDWGARPELEAEIKRQQRPEFDPATRVEQGQRIDARYFLEGIVAASSTELGWSLQLRDSKTNRIVGRYSGQAARDDTFKVPKDIVRRVIADLCSTGMDYSGRRTASPPPPPPPPAPPQAQAPPQAPVPGEMPPMPKDPPPPAVAPSEVENVVNTFNRLRGLIGK